MAVPAFYVVTLTHPRWEEALAQARRLPPEALPELRLDLFPERDPRALVADLGRHCLVSCRRREEGGAWTGDEASRQRLLLEAAQGRPAWLDLEWDLPVPAELAELRGHLRLLRSAHVDGWDLEERLEALPEGDAYKWVGRARRLGDNARVRQALGRARDRRVDLTAFLMGPKGIPSRCLQRAWGGAFTYAAPDGAPPAAPGQLPLARMLSWRCHRLHPGYGLCGVLGEPALHSRGPDFHNPRFQRAFKDLLYLPLECGDPEEAQDALESLAILGASLTAPLKESLPARLGLPGPLNTLTRRHPGEPWAGSNTDAPALAAALEALPGGPVLVLGDGGVARTSREVLESRGLKVVLASRRRPLGPREVEALAPVGVIQATRAGMDPCDLAPFPELLEASRASARWAVEWVYKEETAFAAWARENGLTLVEGASLFEAQALLQSAAFIGRCGG
jgi:3-dehydroquinate dehydratase type I